MNNDLYVWIDSELDIIATLPEPIPKNWRNIHGLNLLDQESLKNLGWYKIDDPDLLNFEHSQEWLSQFKKQILENISYQRWQAQTEAVTYNGNAYVLNDQTITALYQKRLVVESNPNTTFIWKTRDSMIELTGSELINLTNSVNSYIQECFNIEKTFIDAFSSYVTFEDLLEIDLNIAWPSTELT